jgi:hypothetical protein
MIGTILAHLLSSSVSTPINSVFPVESWNKLLEKSVEQIADKSSRTFRDYFLTILWQPAGSKSSHGSRISDHHKKFDLSTICPKSQTAHFIVEIIF